VHRSPEPLPEEFLACRPYLLQEITLLNNVQVVIALGQIAFSAYLTARRALRWSVPSPVPRFGHGRVHSLEPVTLIGSYHPSQQNTFTGRLTREMFRAVFQQARAVINSSEHEKREE
jgi:uracil-DNA glycosylase